jgi:hypothetical protein
MYVAKSELTIVISIIRNHLVIEMCIDEILTRLKVRKLDGLRITTPKDTPPTAEFKPLAKNQQTTSINLPPLEQESINPRVNALVCC